MAIKFCQSCGMPMENDEVRGTEKDGSKSADYCKYCYEQGAFIQPDLSMEEMIAVCVPHMVESGMEENQARAILNQSMPHLKRWSDSHEGCVLTPIITTRDEMKMVGIVTRTSNACEMGPNGAIPKLWQQYVEQQIGEKIPNQAEQPVLLGLYTNYESDVSGEYDMVIGMTVHTLDTIPDGMVGKVIPAAKYAVFTSPKGPFMEVVPVTWQAIWQWMQTTNEVRTYTGDFEYYDERSSNPNDAQVDIYIAIK